jgi:hypothetical protein
MAALNPEISLAKTQPLTQKPPKLHPKNPLSNPAQKAKYFGLGEIG